jgi:hypothetical protein
MFTPLILSLMVANNMPRSAAIVAGWQAFNATAASSAANYVCCVDKRRFDPNILAQSAVLQQAA